MKPPSQTSTPRFSEAQAEATRLEVEVQSLADGARPFSCVSGAVNFRLLAPLLIAPTLLGLPALSAPARADIVWESDYNVARAKAIATGKPLFIDVYTDWCGWCKKLDSTVYPDARVQQLARSFVMVRLNAEGNGAAFARSLRVTGYPTLFFVTARGGQVARIGYIEPANFVAFMQQTLGANGPIRPQRGVPGQNPDHRPQAGHGVQSPRPQSVAAIARTWKKAPEVSRSLQRPGYGGAYVLGDGGPVAVEGAPGNATGKKKTQGAKRGIAAGR